MGLSTRVGATALASLAAFSSVVNAQGFYYQDLGVCAAKFNHQYLGCATVDSALFPYEPTNWDPALTADNSRSYINFDQGDFVNNTVTPHYCAQTCRASGFKYAALYNERSCRCGNTLDYTTIAGISVGLSSRISSTSEASCTLKKSGSPPDPCPGDRRENCGSDQGARIWADPSYPDVTGVTNLAASYNLLGCFKNPRFPSAETYTTVTAATAPLCLQYCANLGMPYAFMIRQTPTVECHCGSEFNKNMAEASSGTSCTSKCSSLTDTTPCTGQDCCAVNGGPAPVYANVNFMGCYVPVIPGKTDPESDVPSPSGYDCFNTPASILNRPTSVVANYNPRTISASASFVATASPSAIAQPFVNFGCWQSKALSDIFNSFTVSTLTASSISVEKCVAYCNAAGNTFAALYGKAPNNNCACSSSLKPNIDTTNVMQDCNQPCSGEPTQNCGGDNGPLIYARNDITPNKWAVQWTSSRSSTPIYQCTGGPTPSSSPASSTAASSTPASSSPASSTPASSSPGSSSPVTSPASSGASSGVTPPASSGMSSGISSMVTPPTSSGASSGAGSPGTDSMSGSMSSSVPTTMTMSTPVGSGGASGSGTSSPTSGASPSSTGPGIPGITDTASSVILQVAPHNPANNKREARHHRRQSVGGFVGGAGPNNPNSCTDATLFGIRSGQLLAGGQTVSTDAGVAYMQFKFDPAGSISRTFTIINGYLHWYNDQFTGGQAQFCQVTDGTVYILFRGDNSGPANCQRVDIVTYYATQCVNGLIISGPVTSGAPTGGDGGSTNTGTGGSMPTGTGGAGGSDGSDMDTPEKDWLFREGHAPDNYPCMETTKSWVPGEPTFLPHNEL
ncbi:hypothetical protein GGR55DRAFT_279287 [Xylaria sp. FL0064]|nr:hypothetical protein GGR55DRAFT_279287 [Xylaria sp. FL0064]